MSELLQCDLCKAQAPRESKSDFHTLSISEKNFNPNTTVTLPSFYMDICIKCHELIMKELKERIKENFIQYNRGR